MQFPARLLPMLLFLSTLTATAGCGKQGPLYLPKPAPQHTPAQAPAPKAAPKSTTTSPVTQ